MAFKSFETISFLTSIESCIELVFLCGRVVTVAASHARGSGFDYQLDSGFHHSEVGKMSSN